MGRPIDYRTATRLVVRMNMYEKCTVHCTVYSVHFTLPTSHKVSIFENAPGRFVMSRYISRETCISGAAEQPVKWGCWVSGVQGVYPPGGGGMGGLPRENFENWKPGNVISDHLEKANSIPGRMRDWMRECEWFLTVFSLPRKVGMLQHPQHPRSAAPALVHGIIHNSSVWCFVDSMIRKGRIPSVCSDINEQLQSVSRLLTGSLWISTDSSRRNLSAFEESSITVSRTCLDTWRLRNIWIWSSELGNLIVIPSK